jgi:MerR family redox-sensitive transcriptional activator SoxR
VGKSAPKHLRIGEVARHVGIRPSAVRYYEQAGLLPRPERAGGKRRYHHSIIRWLQFIGVARKAGFTIAETRQLVQRFAPSGAPARSIWKSLAERKLADLDAQIERIQEMKSILERGLACRCTSLDDCDLLSPSSDAGQGPPASR